MTTSYFRNLLTTAITDSVVLHADGNVMCACKLMHLTAVRKLCIVHGTYGVSSWWTAVGTRALGEGSASVSVHDAHATPGAGHALAWVPCGHHGGNI